MNKRLVNLVNAWVVHIIDEIGSACCPKQWSVDDQPEYPAGHR